MREVGGEVCPGGSDGGSLAEKRALLVGDVDVDVEALAQRGRLAQADLAVRDGHGDARARKAARRPQLGVVLRNDEVGARTVRAEEPGKARGDLLGGLRSLIGGREELLGLLDIGVHLRDGAGLDGTCTLRAVRNRGRDVREGVDQALDGVHIYLAVGEQRGHRDAREALRHGHEDLGAHVVRDAGELLRVSHVLANHGQVGCESPEGTARLLVHVGGRRGERVGVVEERLAIPGGEVVLH